MFIDANIMYLTLIEYSVKVLTIMQIVVNGDECVPESLLDGQTRIKYKGTSMDNFLNVGCIYVCSDPWL